jgi:hypothetical protein
VNAGSGKDWEPLGERSAKENITGEEGERNSLDAIFPLVSGGVKGQESLQPFPRQDLMDTLLVLMASVKSVPSVAGV